jgi:ferredoxin
VSALKIAFYPINTTAEVEPGGNLLKTLLASEIKIRSLCKGRGICATCQVKVRGGANCVTPRTAQESKTLSLIASSDAHTRLACQCRVIDQGLVIELPSGVYVENLNDLLELVGEEAVADYLHPVDGRVLIAKDKIITRSLLMLFKNLTEEIQKVSN